MRYPKLRELKEAIRALIKGPYTSRFPYKPHEPFERFRGNPKFHEKDCIGCTACVNVCPSGALSFEDKMEKGKARRILTHQVDQCIFCGQCEANCPTGEGIKLTRDFDLATLGRREDLKDVIEKELVVCECCLELVAPYDQIIWVAKRLGPLTFSNAPLMLAYLAELNLLLKEKISPKEERDFTRSDRIKIICPRCRREAVIKS
jgi:formate hydrogenlyase subunit 6/NADH:ubiquinone oxidoreductase subunit I